MADAPPPLDARLLRLPGALGIERLDNGLTVCVLRNPQAPLVATSLWYRAGARDEPPGQEGAAHLLEHLMFRGSPRFGAGRVDRLTLAWGGANNAFTSHDATAYHFSFAGGGWRVALEIEADRMTALTLDPEAVEREREVVLEELAMAEDAPWDALVERVHRAAFGEHPYGRPILGERRALESIGPAELAAFHATWYRPANAVLAIAGDVGDEVLDAVAERFGGLAGAAPARELPGPPSRSGRVARVDERRGEVDRLLCSFAAPAADHPDEAPLRVLAAVLGAGRSSRLHLRLVEAEASCAWIAADILDTAGPGALDISAEALPGHSSEAIEAAIRQELMRLRCEPPSAEELARAQRGLVADWAFGIARIEHQAMIVGEALALYDRERPERHLRDILACSRGDLGRAADRWLDPEHALAVGRFRAEREAGR